MKHHDWKIWGLVGTSVISSIQTVFAKVNWADASTLIASGTAILITVSTLAITKFIDLRRMLREDQKRWEEENRTSLTAQNEALTAHVKELTTTIDILRKEAKEQHEELQEENDDLRSTIRKMTKEMAELGEKIFEKSAGIDQRTARMTIQMEELRKDQIDQQPKVESQHIEEIKRTITEIGGDGGEKVSSHT